MKKIIVTLALCVLILSVGCAEVPQSVRDEIAAYNESLSSSENNFSESYVSLGEVIAADTVLSENKGQFITEGIKVKLPDVDSAHSFKLEYATRDIGSELDHILTTQFPHLDLDYIKNTESGDFTYFADEYNACYNDGKSCVVLNSTDGSVRIIHGGSLEYTDFTGSEAYQYHGRSALTAWAADECFEKAETISLNTGETVDDNMSWTLPSGNVKLCDTMDTALDYLSEYIAPIENHQYTYNIRKIYVREVGEGLYGYEFCAERLYKGISLDSTEIYVPDAALGAEDSEIEGSCIYLWMISPDEVDYAYCSSRYDVVESTPLTEPILTVDAAFDLLSDSITSATAFNVESVELLYTVNVPFDYPWEYNPELSEKYYSCQRDSRLVWAVIVEATKAKNCSHDPHQSFFVDALTGEITVFTEFMEY